MDRKCNSEMGIGKFRHSRRIVSTTRSQIAFAFWQCGNVEVNQATSAVLDDDEYVEQPARGSD